MRGKILETLKRGSLFTNEQEMKSSDESRKARLLHTRLQAAKARLEEVILFLLLDF